MNEDETPDTFYQGRVLVLQKKKGYRFALDAPLLADFIQVRPADELLELGTGSGIIPLLLSLKPFAHITAIEIQDALADLARRNVSANRLDERITVVHGDFRKYRSLKKFDVVFSNPPYIPQKTGFLSVTAEKSVAKHELKCDILGVMRATARLLKKDGRAYFIYPARREEDLRKAVEKNGLHLHALRYVHPRKGTAANLFLAECRFSARETRLLPPLVLSDDRGETTAEARQVFEGKTRGPAD
ncbi:MAG: methyltransferase [Candidatus Aminicenantes bacterium]|nr:methyltransferase [Candidatus Aminicenantes bacterium]